MKKTIFILIELFFVVLTSNAQICETNTLKAVIPAYPMVAIALEESGTVKVEVSVDKLGKVIDATATEGPKWLKENSERVSKQWEFSKVKKSSSSKCNTRKSFIIFNYTLLPSTTTGESTWSFIIFPNIVEIREIRPEFIVDPTIDP